MNKQCEIFRRVRKVERRASNLDSELGDVAKQVRRMWTEMRMECERECKRQMEKHMDAINLVKRGLTNMWILNTIVFFVGCIYVVCLWVTLLN